MIHFTITLLLGFIAALFVDEACIASLVQIPPELRPFLIGVGVLMVGLSRDESSRRRAVPPRDAMILALGGVLVASPWGGRTVWLVGGLIVAIEVGVLLAWSVLFAGVQKTRRLHLMAGVVIGAGVEVVASYLLMDPIVVEFFAASRFPSLVRGVGAWGLAAAAIVVSMASFLPAVKSLDMAAPIPEWPWTGWPTSLAMLASGYAFAHVELPLPRALAQLAPYAPLFVMAGATICVASSAAIRRIALVVGEGGLTVAGVLIAAHAWGDRPPALIVASGASIVSWLVIGGVIPLLCRFYAEVPLGSNILAEIPEPERRAPNGSLFRIFLFVLGWTIVDGFGVPPHGHLARLDQFLSPLDVAAIAGTTLILFDPRAGIGRKVSGLFYFVVPTLVARFAL